MNRLTSEQVLRWLIELEDDPARATELHAGARLERAAVRDLGPVSINALARHLDSLRAAGSILFSDQHSEKRRSPGPLVGGDISHCFDFRTTPQGRQEARIPVENITNINMKNATIGQFAAQGDINNLNIVGLLDRLEQEVETKSAPPEEKARVRAALADARQALADVGSGSAGDVLGAAIRSVLNLP